MLATKEKFNIKQHSITLSATDPKIFTTATVTFDKLPETIRNALVERAREF